MSPGTSPTVFVTGASGFLGINLVRFLLARGCAVVAYDLEPFDYPEAPSVSAVIGDVRDERAVCEAMRGCELVIHCAAALPLYREEDIFSTEVEGTRRVLDAAERLGGLDQRREGRRIGGVVEANEWFGD